LPEPGHVKHSGRGEWIVGEYAGATPPVAGAKSRPERVAELCASAGVPCRVSQNVEVDQWTKMVMNCAGNAVTAIAQTSFAHVARNLDTREVLRSVINECVAVARAAGVAMPDVDWTERGLKNAETLGEATSSTAQDIARGKPTEIDSLNGYIVRRGKELGVPTPVNMTLFALIKLIEESSARRSGRAGSASWSAKECPIVQSVQACTFALLIAGVAEPEGNVHHHLDINRNPVACARPEFPTTQRFH
jgi:2-dehydropantoate 2-reductase